MNIAIANFNREHYVNKPYIKHLKQFVLSQVNCEL
jgi:hypothetical protein